MLTSATFTTLTHAELVLTVIMTSLQCAIRYSKHLTVSSEEENVANLWVEHNWKYFGFLKIKEGHVIS